MVLTHLCLFSFLGGASPAAAPAGPFAQQAATWSPSGARAAAWLESWSSPGVARPWSPSGAQAGRWEL